MKLNLLYFTKIHILNGSNTLDIFCSPMYSYAKWSTVIDNQSTISTAIAFGIKGRLSNQKIEPVLETRFYCYLLKDCLDTDVFLYTDT